MWGSLFALYTPLQRSQILWVTIGGMPRSKEQERKSTRLRTATIAVALICALPASASAAMLDNASVLNVLSSILQTFSRMLANMPQQSAPVSENVAAGGNYAAPFAAAQRVDNLSNVTVHGVTGLTASDIPSLSYLSLSGGTVTGDLTVSGAFSGGSLSLSAASTSNLVATNATSTHLAVTGTASTSALVASNSFTFSNVTGFLKAVSGVVSAVLINLTSDVTGVLSVANGGTGWAAIKSGYIPFGNGSSAIATSSSLFWDSSNSRLGIGNAGPYGVLNITPAALSWGQGIVLDAASDGYSSLFFRQTGHAGSDSTGTWSLGKNPLGNLSILRNGLTGMTGVSTASAALEIASSTGTVIFGGNVAVGATSLASRFNVQNSFEIYKDSSADFTFSYPPNAKGDYGELTLAATTSSLNILALQNLSTGGYSALVFRQASSTSGGAERGAMGYGNTATPGPWTDSVFIEASNYDNTLTAAPSAFKIVQTGLLNGSYNNYVRQEFTNDGFINFYRIASPVSTKDFVINSNLGYVGIGTSTPHFNLQIASSTGPQLALSDGSATANPWTFRSIGGAFYLATSSPSTFATSSASALAIDTNGLLSLATALSVNSGGTGANTFGQGWIYSNGGATALAASTSPTVNYITATSTTATSTIGTGGLIVGSSALVVQQGSGKVFVNGTGGSAFLQSGDKLIVTGKIVAGIGTDNNQTDSGDTIYLTNANNANYTQIHLVETNSSVNGYFSENKNGSNPDFGSVTTPALNVWTQSNHPIRFATNGTFAGIFDASQQFGIATTSPWRTLAVTGTVGFDGLTGNFGAGSLCLTANKEVVYNSGSDSCLSSLRSTKHEISPLGIDAFSQLASLHPVSFIYNNDASSTVRYGFIAEDAAAVDPHLATYGADGSISGVDDRGLLAVLVSAVQGLMSRVGNFSDAFATRELTFTRATGDEIDVQKLCIGSTCVTESQLQALLNQVGQQPSAPSAPAPSEGSDASSTPEVIDAPSVQPEEMVATSTDS